MGKKMPVTRVTLDGVSQFPRWYVIVSKYNYEKKLASDIISGKEKAGLDDHIFEVVVPIKETKITKTNAKGQTTEKIKEEKLYPLYVFVKCIMTEQVWNFIKNSEGSQTILAPSGHPTVMDEEDIIKLKTICGLLKKEKEEFSGDFYGKVGDNVLVLDGPFKDMWGPIMHISSDKAKVNINNFPVELPLSILEVVEIVYKN